MKAKERRWYGMVAKLDPGKSLIESLADGTGEYLVETEEGIYRKGLTDTEWVKMEENGENIQTK